MTKREREYHRFNKRADYYEWIRLNYLTAYKWHKKGLCIPTMTVKYPQLFPEPPLTPKYHLGTKQSELGTIIVGELVDWLNGIKSKNILNALNKKEPK